MSKNIKKLVLIIGLLFIGSILWSIDVPQGLANLKEVKTASAPNCALIEKIEINKKKISDCEKAVKKITKFESTKAWHLFIIFFIAILAIIIGAVAALPASILAMVTAVLTGTLTTGEAYSGFGKGFILLILVAFLVANAVIKSGLGKRIALMIIATFGKSTLGLGYSMFFTDLLISPAFPSNTARSGVLYPLTLSLARSAGSKTEDGTHKKLGNYLMMNTMAGLSISSALWVTAMAANPVGTALAADFDIDINFTTWLMASIVPCLVAAIFLPWVLLKVIKPEVTKTPEAPKKAKEELAKMGGLSVQELITLGTFLIMVVLWSLSGSKSESLKWVPSKEITAFAGLAIVMITGVFKPEDMKEQGGALSTFIWFAVLYTMSSSLNQFGFMTWLGDLISAPLEGMNWVAVYIILMLSYVLIHYFFVSQTAQMLALYSVFLGVGLNAGVPGTMLALMLLFATNFFSVITPQGSSANVLSAGSGYLTSGEVYKYGAVITFSNLFIFLVIGTPWVMLVTK